MPTIRVLPPSLASQIAAGEVIERPASAIKELIENSLDADASRCDVEVEAGGIGRFAVTDDGQGMSAEDAALSVQRHATSKLQRFEDLSRVATHGFRGEALPSISSVGRFRLRSRRRDAERGVEVSIDGGAEPRVSVVGMPPGTSVEVRELFFNVPARRKFLRSTNTEAGHIKDAVESAALGRPGVTFVLHRDGKRIREFLRCGEREERVAQILPEEALVRCAGSRGPLALEAFLSRPERARQGAGSLRILLNGRSIRDRMLAATVAQAYGSVMERGRYPRGVVYLELEPTLVDVNVHPQKAEVRFVDPRAVADAVYGLLSRALARSFSAPCGQSPGGDEVTVPAASATRADRPPIDGGAEPVLPLAEASRLARGSVASAAPSPRSGGILHGPSALAGGAAVRPPAVGIGSSNLPQSVGEGASPSATLADSWAIRDAHVDLRSEVKWSRLRFVAQVRQTYLVCEDAAGLYVLDQHAAAERVNFDRLRRQYRDRGVASQALLFPTTVSLAPQEVEWLEQAAEEVKGVGLDVRIRGEGLVSVHAVPRLLQRVSPERIVRDLVSEMFKTGGRAFSDAVDLALATMACHGSIRSGDAVTQDAAEALLVGLDGVDFAGHCPHGRPVVTFTSWAELERKVGRR